MKKTAAVSCALLCVLFCQCDESLPPRNDPIHILEGSMESLAGPVTVIGGEPQGVRGGFRMELRNRYNDVLQGEEHVEGKVDVWVKERPDRRSQVTFTAKNIVNGSQYLGFMTIGVDSAAVVIGQWNHRTTEGIPFWQFVNLFPAATLQGVPFCRSDTVHLMAQGSLQVFKNVQPLKSKQIEFAQVFGISCPPPQDQ